MITNSPDYNRGWKDALWSKRTSYGTRTAVTHSGQSEDYYRGNRDAFEMQHKIERAAERSKRKSGKIKPCPPPKFKKGDRVRYSRNYGIWYVPKGSIGTVTTVKYTKWGSETQYGVRFEGIRKISTGEYSLDLVESVVQL